jgi:DNA-binding response OmpR family regulator
MNKKILIVEDDPDVRQGYHIRLAANGYDTVFAPDGLASISQAQIQRPNLIILDLGLPGGDGFAVLEKLKAIPHLAVIPVIVVSARDPFENRDRALRAGAKAFLQKPVDNAKLLDLIEKHLRGPTKSTADW